MSECVRDAMWIGSKLQLPGTTVPTGGLSHVYLAVTGSQPFGNIARLFSWFRYKANDASQTIHGVADILIMTLGWVTTFPVEPEPGFPCHRSRGVREESGEQTCVKYPCPPIPPPPSHRYPEGWYAGGLFASINSQVLFESARIYISRKMEHGSCESVFPGCCWWFHAACAMIMQCLQNISQYLHRFSIF